MFSTYNVVCFLDIFMLYLSARSSSILSKSIILPECLGLESQERKRIISVLCLPLLENSFSLMSFGKSDVALRAKSDLSQIKVRFALTSLEIVSSP